MLKNNLLIISVLLGSLCTNCNSLNGKFGMRGGDGRTGADGRAAPGIISSKPEVDIRIENDPLSTTITFVENDRITSSFRLSINDTYDTAHSRFSRFLNELERECYEVPKSIHEKIQAAIDKAPLQVLYQELINSNVETFNSNLTVENEDTDYIVSQVSSSNTNKKYLIVAGGVVIGAFTVYKLFQGDRDCNIL